jgi:hypothetical protein
VTEQPNFGEWLREWGRRNREAARRAAAPHDAVPRPTPENPRLHEIDDDEPRVIQNPQAFARRALDAAVANVREATEGFRNHTLNAAAYSLGRLVGADLIDEGTVRDVLHTAADEIGLYPAEIQKTISSGIYSGIARPLAWVRAPMLDIPLGWEPTNESGAPASVDLLRQAALERERALRWAKRQVDAEEAGAQFAEPHQGYRLDEFAQLDLGTEAWVIEGVLPLGSNVTITAPFKTGKTTLVGELVRALVDGVPFLGNHKVAGAAVVGGVALWDYEMTPRQHQLWVRELAIVNMSKAWVRHIRGDGIPLDTDIGADAAVRWLKDRHIGVWILDPFARAFLGDENDNAAVTVWTDRLDRIKARAGVQTLVMPVHTGRRDEDASETRARGATRLDDWPDARWLLSKDRSNVRYFRASGRDVDVDEVGLSYDEQRRRLLGNLPGRAGKRADMTWSRIFPHLQVMGAGVGVTMTEAKALTGLTSTQALADLFAQWEREGRIERSGNRIWRTKAIDL